MCMPVQEWGWDYVSLRGGGAGGGEQDRAPAVPLKAMSGFGGLISDTYMG